MADMRAVLGEEEYLRICHNHDCGPFVDETSRNNFCTVASLGTFVRGAQEMPDEGRLVVNTGTTTTIPVTLPNATTGVGVRMTERQTKAFIHADALNRAWRTFLVSGGLDVLLAAGMTVAVGLANVEWTVAYWVVLGTSVVKTIGATYVAYLLRKKMAPKVGVEVR